MLETAPGELSVYYGEHFKRPTCRIRRATYRTDGFVSVHAGYGGGQMVTKSLTFAGDELVMNFSTPAVGGVRAESRTGTEGQSPAASSTRAPRSSATPSSRSSPGARTRTSAPSKALPSGSASSCKTLTSPPSASAQPQVHSSTPAEAGVR